MSPILTFLEYCVCFFLQLSVFTAFLYVGIIGQGPVNHISNFRHKTRRISTVDIYDLSDEALIKAFYHCRSVLSNDDDCILEERKKWENERWWYNLTHVCRKWRFLVLASASHLQLYHLCTYGTPVADMLTYLPALPLVVDYGDEDREVTAEDEEGILLVLRRRRRVRRIRLWMPAASLRRLLATIDGEFPMLENLYIKPLTNDNNCLLLPWTFTAPQLRHFALRNITYPLHMLHPPPPIPYPSSTKSTEIISKLSPYYGSQLWRSLKMFIHILDNDSLLNIFRCCQPVLVDEDETYIFRILQGGRWDRDRWWYKLAHVCQRWRWLIFASASHLKLSLVCTRGTPVADMLANSPPLPLIIDHIYYYTGIATEDEEGIMLALHHRDRVRRIRLRMPFLNLEKLVRAMDGEFPILEYLYIEPWTKCNSWLTPPDTFQAPHLRHLNLKNFALPIRYPLITTNPGLATLSLSAIPLSLFPNPNDLLQKISLMPQLETLRIVFHAPVPNRDLQRQLSIRPLTTRVILPNLRWFGIRTTSAYMESLLPRMTAPLLERLEAWFFLQLGFSVPRLLEFMSALESLRFGSAKFHFHDDTVYLRVYPHYGAPTFSFSAGLWCKHIDWQVSFAAQLFRTLRTVFSAVEHLTLEFQRSYRSSEMNNNADRTQWRELLGSFSNVKILRVNEDFRGQISRSLQVDDGESPLGLLSELKELQISQQHDAGGAFKGFIDARKNAGHPITLVHY